MHEPDKEAASTHGGLSASVDALMRPLKILLILVVFLIAIGVSWVEIAMALPIVFLFPYAMTATQRFIERRYQRKVASHSERFAAVYFGIGCGISISAFFFLHDSHVVFSLTITFVAIILGQAIATATLGDRI